MILVSVQVPSANIPTKCSSHRIRKPYSGPWRAESITTELGYNPNAYGGERSLHCRQACNLMHSLILRVLMVIRNLSLSKHTDRSTADLSTSSAACQFISISTLSATRYTKTSS